MNMERGFLASIAFLALLGCHGADSSSSKPGKTSLLPTTEVVGRDVDAASVESARIIERGSIALEMIRGLPAALNEFDEGGIIPECEASDYQAIPVAESRGIPSDISAWMDEEFVAVFLHNLGCYHLATQAANSPIDDYVTISLKGVHTLVTNALSQRFGIERITQDTSEYARAHLKSPRNLRRLYNTFRPQIIELLRASRKNYAIKRELELLIPYFDQSFSDEVITLSLRESIAHQRYFTAIMLRDEELGRSYQEHSAHGGENSPELTAAEDLVQAAFEERNVAYERLSQVVQSPATLQWVLRRRAEGGQSLVRAWGEILKDLHRSI